MSLEAPVRFIADLFDSGRIVLDGDTLAPARDVSSMTEKLIELEKDYRSTLPHQPPSLLHEAAEWACQMLYRACQFLVYREHGKQTVEEQLSVACPQKASPAVCYSVDLTFRFLPDLVRLARAAAEHDPLLTPMLRWASDWPLSSVGIKGVEGVEVEPFIDNPCLRLIYVDRIISQTDVSRLSDERVRDAVRVAIGAFPELVPDLRPYLQSVQSTETS